MNKFHICYLITKELCSGKNVYATNYVEAVKIFAKEFGDKEIVYVTKLTA
jgi:hypothetical protein